MTSKWH